MENSLQNKPEALSSATSVEPSPQPSPKDSPVASGKTSAVVSPLASPAPEPENEFLDVNTIGQDFDFDLDVTEELAKQQELLNKDKPKDHEIQHKTEPISSIAAVAFPLSPSPPSAEIDETQPKTPKSENPNLSPSGLHDEDRPDDEVQNLLNTELDFSLDLDGSLPILRPPEAF